MADYIKTIIWKIKTKLQYTGWLQYAPPIILAALFYFLALIFWFIEIDIAAYILIFLGSTLLLIDTYEIITIKFKIHPAEKKPEHIKIEDKFDLIRSRRSCRSFQNCKLSADDYNELMTAVHYHTNNEKEKSFCHSATRFEYINAPVSVWPVVGATEFLVAIVPKEYNRQSIIGVGKALQKIVIDATNMGIATCWIGPGADHASVKKHLGSRFDEEKDHIICLCAIGYKSKYKILTLRIVQALQRKRLPLSSLFFLDAPFFNTPLNTDKKPFSKFARNYEICQWSPSSFNGQTTRCSAVLGDKINDNDFVDEKGKQLLRFDFYANTDSKYYAPVALGIWCANWEMGCEALGIAGYFTYLSEKKRGLSQDNLAPEIPRYDMSWVLK